MLFDNVKKNSNFSNFPWYFLSSMQLQVEPNFFYLHFPQSSTNILFLYEDFLIFMWLTLIY